MGWFPLKLAFLSCDVSYPFLMSDQCQLTLTHRLQQAGVQLDVLLLKESTTSTNEELMQLVKQHPQLSTALICSKHQTHGRGQHTRTWYSPVGNIYFSCLAQVQPAIDGRFALEVALNCLNCPTLKPYDLSLKWANDLYSPQGKWGGILIEPVNRHVAVVGIGINLYPLPPQEKQFIQQASTSLTELNIPFERLQLISELYLAVQQAVQWFNFGSYRLSQRFNHCAYLLGESIQFDYQHHLYQGQYLGINDQGALCLLESGENETLIRTFYQGRILLNTP